MFHVVLPEMWRAPASSWAEDALSGCGQQLALRLDHGGGIGEA